MKKMIALGIGASMLFLGGCVENSAKYRRLVAQVDSLSAVSAGQNQELESVYADFINVDTRDFDAIELNEKKAKVLSAHPEGSYALEAGEDGKLVLKILDGQAFWQQTRYLVVMVG